MFHYQNKRYLLFLNNVQKCFTDLALEIAKELKEKENNSDNKNNNDKDNNLKISTKKTGKKKKCC